MKAKKKNLATAHTLDALHAVIAGRRRGDPATSYTAKLFRRGTNYVAKKLAEEAAETVIDAVARNRVGVVRESADLLYHLTVLWAASGVTPARVWAELRRREGISGLIEKAGRTEDRPKKRSAKKRKKKKAKKRGKARKRKGRG